MSYSGKAIILGNAQVGKTSLLSRYVDDKFPEKYNPTIGANFLVKEVDLTSVVDNLDRLDDDLKEKVKEQGFKIYFWDIGGQKDKLFANEYYFQDAVGAIVVFDLANQESFEHLEFWVSKLKALSGDIPFILVGNKIDLSDKREIERDQIDKKREELGTEYFETSAKTDENVRKAFEALSAKILNNLK
ncbi:MAG: GTP-binding protein [Candidatus Lokiarchaeota archaeon]|jgi:small GTP-binding protein|nr:GTP-binding protein [Candidatus Lokiarchaeota archaeon]